MTTLTLDRREFLKTGTIAGAGLLIGFHLSEAVRMIPLRNKRRRLRIRLTRGCILRRTTA